MAGRKCLLREVLPLLWNSSFGVCQTLEQANWCCLNARRVPLLVSPCRELVEVPHQLKWPALHANARGSIFSCRVGAVLAVHLKKIAFSMQFVEAVKSVLSIKCLLVFSSNIRYHLINNESWVCCVSILFHLYHLLILGLEIYNDSTEPGHLA